VAAEVEADAYGECSVQTNENVEGVWEGFINHVLASLTKRSAANASARKRERARTAVAGLLARCGMGRLGSDRQNRV